MTAPVLLSLLLGAAGWAGVSALRSRIAQDLTQDLRPGPRRRPARPLVLLEVAFWAVAVVIGALQQWASIDFPSSIDLVSYLDVGDGWIHGPWKEAINGYWNPLYSWILALVLAIVRPSPRFEYPAVEAADFVIFLCALASFAWFLGRVRESYGLVVHGQGDQLPRIPDWAWLVGGYTLFIWASVEWITLSSNTPDMCAAALAYLAWGLVLRMERCQVRLAGPILGLLLALGYYSRTPMLLVGAAFVTLVALRGLNHESVRKAGTSPSPGSSLRRQMVVAGVVLLALTSPFIAAVSHARGHFTIGDNGRLNHAWLANPRSHVIPNRYWQGGPQGYGAPIHAVRVLWKDPPAYEFGKPIGGTYPPWTDPSYWYEGLRYRFDAAAERRVLVSNARFYYHVFGWWILVALVVTLLLSGDVSATARAFMGHARYWLPPLLGLGLYLVAADLHIQRLKLQPPQRYVAAFVVLLCVMLAFSIRFRRGPIPRITRMCHAGLGAALIVVSAVTIARLTGEQLSGLSRPLGVAPWRTAQAIQGAGVGPRMAIATVGRPDYHEFWARLLRERIVADVPDDRAFWAASPQTREQVLDRLSRAGARLAVCRRMPDGAESEGWRHPAGSLYGLRWLDR